jgi:threonine/homoserine/homoserine lactone efflux protein
MPPGGAILGVFAIVFAAGATAAFLVRLPGWLRVERYLMATVLGGLAVSPLLDHSRPSPA